MDRAEPNLGFPLFGDVWCFQVLTNKGNLVTVAFSKEQALEIARRINEYYPPPQEKIVMKQFNT